MTETPCRCTCFLLRRAARRTTQVYDRELGKVGLSLNEYSILRRAGQPRQLGALAERLGMDRSTLSRNLKPMLDAGWVEERRGDDARQKLVVVSAAGRRLLKRALPHWQRAQARIDALAGPERIDALHEQLRQLERALHTTGAAA
ncbi:winged helix-turn-helix transcriptional regulator [Xanthomonas sp. AmX2]|uniref:MarR family winged helix-turn-helix transcriptional regulator n=1 Tax=Xanthomonas sp. TaxID=29446 RepID=UPI00197FC521|nr:MarR family winged helix-turn-helix transcriptional regulator [Xanthomonas sp.]MBN6151534.1 winged helix-turn-helix transcriptional regulator [Xanthomonas sp.]